MTYIQLKQYFYDGLRSAKCDHPGTYIEIKNDIIDNLVDSTLMQIYMNECFDTESMSCTVYLQLAHYFKGVLLEGMPDDL